VHKRAANLNIFTIKYPITAFVSILHRISGVLLFLAVPLLIWMLSKSLTSKHSFNALRDSFSSPVSKFLVWLIFSALIYHLISGIRHIAMDLGVGKTKKASTFSAQAVLIISIINSILLGAGIW
jgi:succinate dehydrogenase / fumarate reductase, cytochrome b subunit